MPLSSRILFLSCIAFSALWISSGCTYSYTNAQLTPDSNFSSSPSLKNAKFTDQAVTLGVALDVRWARFVYGTQYTTYDLDADVQAPASIRETTPDTSDQSGEPVRFVRLDVPVLTLWNFKEPNNHIGYPGTMKNRQTVEFWLRSGVSFPLDDKDAFLGGAFTFYYAPYAAVSLTVDWRSGPRSITLINNGQLSTLSGTAAGPVFGIEITAGAGEVVLNMLKDLWKLDEAHQKRIRQRKIAR